MTASDTNAQPLPVVVAANFTAEPLNQALQYWLSELQIPSTIQHAPYDQAFQQLLDPSSAVRGNRDGINVVLVRLETWLNPNAVEVVDLESSPLDRIVEDLISAVDQALADGSSQFVLCFAPPTRSDEATAALIRAAEERAHRGLLGRPGLRVVTSASMLESYPCADYADDHGERLANMPYAPVFFTVLGTVLARAICALTIPAHKVIVLDCDDTLWGGLCGELGPGGVTLSAEHLALQRFALAKRQEGKLLCLASRNNEADVLAVFDQNPSMVLTRDDITGWQIHWGLKSDSVADLAATLGLGLDSFVFLDDDPMHCAEVQRRFPQVLAVQVPKREIARFCLHLWPLDARPETREGSRRTEAYREHAARESVRASSLSFREFIDSLDLQVDISALTEQDLARATELTHRTNQFNMTGVKMSEAEFRERVLRGHGMSLGVRVRDRFGDYGLVGLVNADPAPDALSVSVFLLSCRALGRGVEHRMVAQLGELARQRGVVGLELRAEKTARNKPARDFLRQFGAIESPETGALECRLDAATAAAVRLDLGAAPQRLDPTARVESDTRPGHVDVARRVALLSSIPTNLNNADAIHAVVHGIASTAGGEEGPIDADTVEAVLVRAFSEQLGVSTVLLDEGFFDLGGHSLQAVQILSHVSAEFGVELDPTLLFTTNFSVRELAEEIGFLRESGSQGMPGVLAQLSAITDD
jgi:FkbH-like protein